MKPENDIKRIFHKAAVSTYPSMDQMILEKVLTAHETASPAGSTVNRSNIRRTIMKSPITKLAIAATVLIAVFIGISQLGGSSTAIVWAEVANQVNASRGLIYRERTLDPKGSDDGAYIMYYASPTHMRTDSHKGNKITRSIYLDCAAKVLLLIEHNDKVCWHHPADDRDVQDNERQLNLKGWVEETLSRQHTNLGRRTIDGVLCEGIETRYAIFGDTNSLTKGSARRVWVSVETGYPVLCEGGSFGEDGRLRIETVLDQFQWDVELDASELEPNIPSDYEQM